MWFWSRRSSPSVRQRRHDRSRIHRSLWPSHPASVYPRCLRITQQAKRGWQRKVKREREAEWSQSYPKLYGHCSLQDVRTRGLGWGVWVSLFGSTAWSSSYHHHHPPHWCQEVGWGEKRRRRVLVKTVEGHWSHKFKVGTQTHTSTTKSSLIECVRVNSFRAVYSKSEAVYSIQQVRMTPLQMHEITALRSETTSLCPPLRGLMQLVRTENILWNIAKSVPKIKGLIST